MSKDGGLSVVQGMVLDMTAAGKSPREIAGVLGIKPAEAAKMAYDLLDSEIITDAESRRKLQVYRLEKLVEALWQRTMDSANALDVKNLREILADLNVLLGLNKEHDAEMMTRMHAHQLQSYITAIKSLIVAFKMVAPNLMTEEQWSEWAATQLEEAQNTMELEEIE